MSTLVNENEMSTKVDIVFVSTVGLQPSGDWRHKVGSGCHIYECIYMSNLRDHNREHVLSLPATENTSTHSQVPTTQSKDALVC